MPMKTLLVVLLFTNLTGVCQYPPKQSPAETNATLEPGTMPAARSPHHHRH